MLYKFIKIFIIVPILIVTIFVSFGLIFANFLEPSNHLNWKDDQKILPYAEINKNLVSIHNIRNFSYTSTSEYTKNYYDKVYDTNKLKKVWYIVEPFSGFPGSAHTFLSFEFENNVFVSISVEIRKEQDESFSAVKGLFNQYELMYVIADEKDVIKLRSNYRNDLVYVYPINTTKEKAVKLFIDMIDRVNSLKNNPEFYNTVTNNCTINIVRHVNKITPKRVPLFNLRVVLPENSDKLAYNLGLIDTKLSFEKAREYFNINHRAIKYADNKDFSVKIRTEDRLLR